MEQLESRALGKPKETVEQTVTEPEAMTALRGMSTEDLIALLAQRRHLRVGKRAELRASGCVPASPRLTSG
jgi:hypothetical protein